MPIVKPRGLQGLKGLGNLSKAQYDAFVSSNRDLIAQHGYDPIYINNLYSNKQFIDKYGIDKFKAIPDIEMRNDIYKADLVNTEFDKLYKPSRTNKGLGNDYMKYSQMSTDAKLKMMESDYLSPTEFEDKWQQRQKQNQNIGNVISKGGWGLPDPSMGGFFSGNSTREASAEAVKDPIKEEAVRRKALDVNQRILDKIYNDDVDARASAYSQDVSQVYLSLAGMSDEQVKKAFIQAITPNSYKGNMGIAEYASHYGKGTDNDITSEMQDFSIDDMRQVLAKKKVYDAYMSPDMAATALNNDAKRYITEHQGAFKKFGLFAKDVAISTMSYTADKMNGIAELYRMGQDRWAEKPVVLVDDKGNVIDKNKVKIARNTNGNLYYQDTDGTIHPLHQERIDYTTLHQMGKNPDGSDIEGAFGIDWMTLNPQYWTRAEQFGTLDDSLQKQYEKLGSSPYKVSYNPNEEGDLWYDAFKMMSFGIADAMSNLIPYGIGMFGRTLSTANSVGKVARGFGKVLDTTGKMLSAESKVGQVAQGTAGALGIAYAYGRGAFQETLAQNLANAEEAALNASKNDIFNQYHNDREYKSQVDKLINARATAMKADYIAQMRRDGGMQIADEKALDKMLYARAQDEVLGELVQSRVNERKASSDYANLQQEAINSAGDAAFNTFLPEAVKYGFVNTMGYRKFLYTNPAGLSKKMSSSLKGLKEITTSAGRKRMTTEASKFLTRGDKLKEFGKTFGSQVWGGSWTNGTDDMQVDAAERINEDSYNRYLQAYQNGEAMANTYGFADGLYSYLKGLGNSLGQDTTWNSAIVGGLGSVVNVNANFANIARLATKEGRRTYRDTFRRDIVRDKDGLPVKNEDGSLKYKNYGKSHNWREQVNYFVQNGVLNTYYGKKQAERDLRSHADYVNNILDNYDDFVDIEHLVASNLASENLQNLGDQKTMDFIKALHAINTLDNLGRDSNDPTTMSSVVQNAKTLIEKAAQLNDEQGNSPFTEEEISNLLSQYYASNPDLEQSDENNLKALYNIASNAQKLQEAAKAFDKAEKEIQKIEKNKKISIDPIARNWMKVQQALNDHWTERKEKMQSEIGDTSQDSNEDTSLATLLHAIGGINNAKSLVKVYERQEKELDAEWDEEYNKAEPLLKKYDEAPRKVEEARKKGDINGSLQAQDERKEAGLALRNYFKKEKYYKDLIAKTKANKSLYEDAIKEAEKEDSTIDKDKILSAKEIFSLDPVTRAKMMREENRNLYSDKQQREIEKLEKRLLMKDADALQKIQDIALLTQRIASNQDAYARIAQDPEAAAFELEEQREKAAKASIGLINQRNAETTVDTINQFDESIKAYTDITEDDKNGTVFRILRRLNPEVLDIIDNDNLLPKYSQQVKDAKEWGRIVGDIAAVIEESNQDKTWKENLLRNINSLVESSNTREEVMAKLEKAVDDTDGSIAASDLDFVLNGLENLGYQRDATTLSNRKERQRKQEEERKKKEEEEKKSVEEAKAAADKKAEEEKNTPKEELGQDLSTAMVDAETPDVSGSMSTDEISKSVTPDVDTSHSEDELKRAAENSGIDTSMSEEELRKSATGEETPLDLTSTPKEKGETSRLGQLSPLMSDAAKEGDGVKLGNNIIAERTQNQIIFNLDKGDEGKVPVTLNITPDEYETNKDSLKDDKKTSFEASYLKKEGDDWYFVGNFAGSDKKTKVKAKNTSIENQALQQKKGSVAKEETHPTDELVYKDDAAEGNSPSIEKQYEEATAEGNDNVHISDTNEDSAETNGTGEFKINNDATTLTANSMSLYESGVLATKGILQRKKGAEEGDRRNTYYAWMDAAGIKLQNIIDNELARIIQRNPHAKVKFMGVKPERNATNDYDMFEHLMLVLDYDDKVNEGITSIHDDSNGGVIESDGKKYLIIGVAGYGDRNLDKRALYFRLWSPQDKNGFRLKTQRKKFFDKHPNERFYVNQELSTEVVPYSLIPGYIVKQTEKDSEPGVRSVSELLADKERNPLGITMEKAAWGIQEMSKFLLVNATPDQVMVPRNALGNMGSAFVLMPASNGKLVPSYLRVLKYSEMNDGALKERVDNLLQDVVGPNYDKAIQAIVSLHNLLYLNSEGDDILRRKTKNEVSLVHDGEIVRTFVLDSNFERPEFIKAFETDVNPRVNITARVLNNPELLRQYDEAGALMTDVALFGTAGSSYSVYGLDGNGDMIIPKAPINETAKSKNSSDFKNSKSQVIYNHQYYVEDNGVYSLNGKTITDEKLLEQLKYNKMIVDSELIPALTKGTMDYFILSTGEHPNVIKVNQNTKEVKELSEKAAKDLIEKVNEKKAKEQREEEAKNAMDDSSKIKAEELEEAPLDMGNDFEIDPNTGGMITTQPKKEKVKVEEKEETPKEDKPTENTLADKTVENLNSTEQKEGTQKFTDLMRDMRYLMEIRRVIKKKWENAPKGINDLMKFLKEKNIEVDAIGTSEADIQAWIKTLEDCR